MSNVLDVGCGKNKIKNAIGIDSHPDSSADVLHDLNTFPYPFPDSYFDQIYAIDVLEHLNDVIKVIEELHRLLKPGGGLKLQVPHFSSVHAFTDITHRHFFSTESFDYFCGGFKQYGAYSKEASFNKISLKINFWKLHRFDGMSMFANFSPHIYEKYLAFIFPAMNVYLELQKP